MFFLGHKDAPATLFPELEREIKKCIDEENIKTFFVGNHGNFDLMCIEALKKWKVLNPEIQPYLLTPYYSPLSPIFLPHGFNGTYFPEGMERIPPKFAIPRLNHMMIKECDYLIAFLTHTTSPLYPIFQYALSQQKKNKLIIRNLGSLSVPLPHS